MRTQLRERRLKLGLSQQEVADKTGMTRGNYAHIERGRHEPNLEQIELIGKALKIKVHPWINFFKNYCDESYQDVK